MLDRSKDKPRDRNRARLTLEDYIKHYAHPFGERAREPRGGRGEEGERAAADHQQPVDEGAAGKAVAEQVEPGVLLDGGASESELVAGEERQGDEHSPQSAIPAQPVRYDVDLGPPQDGPPEEAVPRPVRRHSRHWR